MRKIAVIFQLAILLSFTIHSCGGTDDQVDSEPPPLFEYGFAKGADVSWVTEMEVAGKKFYTKDGVETECFALMKQLGMNSIRLRVWVDPIDGWCGKDDFIVKAQRAHEAGMRLMVNFHYSDFWADPGKQNKPAAWKNLSFENLKIVVAQHTKEILNALKAVDIEPEWIQIGNETSNGMLWNDGKASENMEQYAQLHNAGYNAAKAIFPKACVMVHLDNGYNKGLYSWLLGGMMEHGAKWDAVGMSLYPGYADWRETSKLCLENIEEVISTYNCDVVIAEVGMRSDNPSEAKAFLTELITEARKIKRCHGVFYWEPQSYSWNGYGLGAFDNNGRPTIALDPFLD